MIRIVVSALIFLVVYILLHKTRGSWIWLLFACLAIPVIGLSKNGFFSEDLPAYGIACLWIAGMIVPWFVLKKVPALIYTGIDLICWPLTVFFGMQYGERSFLYRVMLAFWVLIMIFNVFLIWKMTRKKYE